MHTQKDRLEKAKASGQAKTSLELEDHTLAIVFGGMKTLQDGPYKGERAVSPTRVYVHGKMIGLLAKVEFSQGNTEPLPQVTFTFVPAPTQLLKTAMMRAAYEMHVERIRGAMPWATILSPIGDYEAQSPAMVFDPGTIKADPGKSGPKTHPKKGRKATG